MDEAPTRGTRLGHFEIEDELGAGGMGLVFGARDLELGRKVAVKVLRPEAVVGAGGVEAQARLLREARAMARLTHPNVVRVHELGGDDAQLYLVMELIEGSTLGQWLAEHARGAASVLEVFLAAADGLVAAHAVGLVHRDFKPDNVLIDRGGRVRVTDFGLVCVSGEQVAAAARDRLDLLTLALTQTGALVGTPRFMAPEQFLARPVDARTDQFAFCVALWAALYGEPPFAGERYGELMDNVIEGRLREVPTGRAVAPPIHEAMVRGLAVDPEQRHSSMAALVATLRAAPPPVPRRWLPRVGVAALGAAAIVVVVLLATRTTTPTDAAPAVAAVPARDAAVPAPCVDCLRLVELGRGAPRVITEAALDVAAGRNGWLAWTERRGDGQRIVGDESGVFRDMVAPELSPRQPAFSPDGLRFAFRSTRVPGLYIGTTSMLTPQPITDGDDADPAWLDDQRLAFTRRDAAGVPSVMVVSLRVSAPPERLFEQPRRVLDADPAGGALLLADPEGQLRVWSEADGRERAIAGVPEGWRWAGYDRDAGGVLVVTARAVWRVSLDGDAERLHEVTDAGVELVAAVRREGRGLILALRPIGAVR